MTAPRVQNERTDKSSVDSEDVVAASTAGVIDAMEVPELSVEEPSLPTSVMPGNAALNAPGGINALAILQAAAQTAFEVANEPRPLVSVPTADLISHTSFKSGSKFVLRIVPTQDNTSKDKNLRTQVDNDSQLFFDRASLQSTNEIHEERWQMFESFDAETLFLMGEKPKIWTFQVIIANGEEPRVPAALNAVGAETARKEFLRRWNMSFCDEFMRRYDKYYRGTAALRMQARLYMSFENVLIEATLLAMVASRNNVTPGAVPVSLTFAVHQRQIMGESLSFGGDATLSELLASEDMNALIANKLSPTAIVPPKKSALQLLVEYADNQDTAQASQAQATEIQVEAAALAELQAESEARADALAESEVALDAQIAAESDPEARAALMVVREKNHKALVDAVSTVQECEAASDAREEDMETATSENETAIQRQQTSETQLQQSADGDLTTSSQSIVFFVELLVTNDDDTREILRFRCETESDANTLAAALNSGTTPDGANLISEETVLSSDPEYRGVPDGVTVFRERAA